MIYQFPSVDIWFLSFPSGPLLNIIPPLPPLPTYLVKPRPGQGEGDLCCVNGRPGSLSSSRALPVAPKLCFSKFPRAANFVTPPDQGT